MYIIHFRIMVSTGKKWVTSTVHTGECNRVLARKLQHLMCQTGLVLLYTGWSPLHVNRLVSQPVAIPNKANKCAYAGGLKNEQNANHLQKSTNSWPFPVLNSFNSYLLESNTCMCTPPESSAEKTWVCKSGNKLNFKCISSKQVNILFTIS